jgi:hypothetical protein
MKQGSTDDPFAEEPDVDTDADEEPDGDGPDSDPTGVSADSDGAGGTEDRAQDDDPPDGGSTQGSVQPGSLPYIHARDGVKDGRTQRPVFLRDHVEAGIDDLVAEMEAELGEDVYKTDVTEAAMAVAQENPELVLAKLEEWGYGWT